MFTQCLGANAYMIASENGNLDIVIYLENLESKMDPMKFTGNGELEAVKSLVNERFFFVSYAFISIK